MQTRVSDHFHARGFTLIEMVIVLVVVGAIFGIGAMGLGRAFESYDVARKTTDTDWQGRVALERMARELRDIRSATAADLSFPGGFPANNIRFVDVDGNSACFVLSGTSVQRGDDGPAAASCATNLRPLADNVVANGLNFYYYTTGGAAPANVTLTYYITVTLQVAEGTINETYRATVQPRRF